MLGHSEVDNCYPSLGPGFPVTACTRQLCLQYSGSVTCYTCCTRSFTKMPCFLVSVITGCNTRFFLIAHYSGICNEPISPWTFQHSNLSSHISPLAFVLVPAIWSAATWHPLLSQKERAFSEGSWCDTTFGEWSLFSLDPGVQRLLKLTGSCKEESVSLCPVLACFSLRCAVVRYVCGWPSHSSFFLEGSSIC